MGFGRSLNSNLCFFGLIVSLCPFFFPSNVYALQALNEQELSEVTGREGVAFDIQGASGIEVDQADYLDNDGYNNGEAGTLRFETVCFAAGATCGNSLDLSGGSINVDGSVSVGGSDRSAIVIDFPSSNGNPGIGIDAIHPGDPSATSGGVGRVELLASSTENTTLELAANDEGFIGDVDLGLHFDQLNYLDRDSVDNGTLQINNIHLDDGSATPGNPASLEGFTIDVDGNSGISVGMPTGTFTLTTGVIHTGDPGNSEMTDQVAVNDVDLGNTSFEVTAN